MREGNLASQLCNKASEATQPASLKGAWFIRESPTQAHRLASRFAIVNPVECCKINSHESARRKIISPVIIYTDLTPALYEH